MLDSHTAPESSTARRACCLDTSLLGITMSQLLSLHSGTSQEAALARIVSALHLESTSSLICQFEMNISFLATTTAQPSSQRFATTSERYLRTSQGKTCTNHMQ